MNEKTLEVLSSILLREPYLSISAKKNEIKDRQTSLDPSQWTKLKIQLSKTSKCLSSGPRTDCRQPWCLMLII